MARSRNAVEGRQYIEAPGPNSNIKNDLKQIFVKLLWELFGSEKTDNFGFTPDHKLGGGGLRVWSRFPQQYSELPVITVSATNLSFQSLILGSRLPREYSEAIDAKFNDNSESGWRQAYSVRGDISFDVSATSDNLRDNLIDKIVDYIIWKTNDADLDVRQYLLDRGVVLNNEIFSLAGDQEIPLVTGDLMYSDGLRVPFYAEIYSPKTLLEPLEGIDWIPEVAAD